MALPHHKNDFIALPDEDGFMDDLRKRAIKPGNYVFPDFRKRDSMETDKVKNAKIPKDREPHTLTLDECRALLAAAPDRSKRGGRFAKSGARPAAKTEEPAAAAPAAAPAKAKKTASAKTAAKAKTPAKKTPARK